MKGIMFAVRHFDEVRAQRKSRFLFALISGWAAVMPLACCSSTSIHSRIDRNHNGTVSVSEYHDYLLRREFLRLDQDGNDALDLQEWGTDRPFEIKRARFKSLDFDLDEHITFNEFIEEPRRHLILATSFVELDTNADGSLSEEEWVAGTGNNPNFLTPRLNLSN